MEYTNLGKYKVAYSVKKEYHTLKNEIFNQEIYFFKSNNQSPFIVDIGSHIGISILYFKHIYPNSEIIGFEPNPNTFEILEENISLNSLNNVTLVNKAVYINNENTLLYIPYNEKSWDSNSSLLEGSWNSIEKCKPISIECTTLNPYIQEIKQIDMLKIDTEGVELSILKSHTQILDSVLNICIEYHPTKGKKFDKILNILKPHFEIEILCEGKRVKNIPKNSLLTIKGKKIV